MTRDEANEIVSSYDTDDPEAQQGLIEELSYGKTGLADALFSTVQDAFAMGVGAGLSVFLRRPDEATCSALRCGNARSGQLEVRFPDQLFPRADR